MGGSTYATSDVGNYKSSNLFLTSNQVNLFDNTSNEWYMTGAQLEIGTQATTFEHHSFNEEKHLCKRYYAQIEQTLYGCAYSTGSGFVHHFHNPEMRATPSFNWTGRATSTGWNYTSYSNNKIFQVIMSHLSPYIQGATWEAEL